MLQFVFICKLYRQKLFRLQSQFVQRYRIIKVGLFSVCVSTSLTLIIAIHHALDITSRKSHISTVKGLALHEFPHAWWLHCPIGNCGLSSWVHKKSERFAAISLYGSAPYLCILVSHWSESKLRAKAFFIFYSLNVVIFRPKLVFFVFAFSVNSY